MSELIDNATRRKDTLKHLIRQLHSGESAAAVRAQLIRMLGQVPYGDVVAAEQELIDEGLPTEEVLKLCDLHSAVLHGTIDAGQAPEAPPGHPVHTFRQENQALTWEVQELERLYASLPAGGPDLADTLAAIRLRFNSLMDVDKHYLRKEQLLFPYLEKKGITGPPKVMWGKHDETRALLKGAIAALDAAAGPSAAEAAALAQLVLRPASLAVADMVTKEEQILLPMCLDTLDDAAWLAIKRQSLEYGYCLVDPSEDWSPAGAADADPGTDAAVDAARLQLPSGSLTPAELQAILNTIPFDLTFVDRDDTVRYFTQGRERIFSRSRAILGRKVQYCHPPSSVDVVERILRDFKSGAHDHASFWITMKGRFLSIEYFALRDGAGAYLGCLEVSQDLTAKRALTGEQRLLHYADEGTSHVQ